MPLVKSSGSNFYTILGAIVEKFYTEPFVIGVYHGYSKPDNFNELLRPFVTESIKYLQEGVKVGDKIVQVTIDAVVADAPAKAEIMGTKGHTGHFACPKCIQEGVHFRNRMTFPEIHSTARTHDSFKNRLHPEHHNTYSCLEEMLTDIIKTSTDRLHALRLSRCSSSFVVVFSSRPFSCAIKK